MFDLTEQISKISCTWNVIKFDNEHIKYSLKKHLFLKRNQYL